LAAREVQDCPSHPDCRSQSVQSELYSGCADARHKGAMPMLQLFAIVGPVFVIDFLAGYGHMRRKAPWLRLELSRQLPARELFPCILMEPAQEYKTRYLIFASLEFYPNLI
jgi:hypothetical protein